MSAANAALARRFFEEVWNQRRAEVIDEVLAAGSVCHGDTGPLVGPDGFKAQQYHPFLAAFPDATVTVEGVVADGDTVVVRWTGVGTHTGAAMGMAATGRPVRFEGMSWIVVRDGQFQTGWQWSNIPAVLASLRGPISE